MQSFNPSASPEPEPSPTPVDKSVERRLNVDQMMKLIDSILPFEACLYYQVIPLSVEDAYLNLGMVNSEDTASMDYVQRQVSYINCSVIPWEISSDWHREMLSRYLSHAAKTKKQTGRLPLEHFNTHNLSETATYIVDSPEELYQEASSASASPSSTSPSSQPAVGQPPPEKSSSDTRPQAQPPQPQPPLQLELPETNTNSLDELSRLPPPTLKGELLKRVLTEGIGRLFFERRKNGGRVLWSKDGVVQAALENLSLDMFQSLINEFKRLSHLPLLTSDQPRQAEIERWHNQQRVLIRFRVMPGKYGEEATLQVLRGAALKFYQQQQISQMGHDALDVAHNLQKRVSEIRERARQAIRLEPMSASTLTAISGLLKDIDGQLEQLIHQQTDNARKPEGDSTIESPQGADEKPNP
jgi:type II secretory ATPase GspE/PulE/Tfp pilus assembly ATPase PilB-like protein